MGLASAIKGTKLAGGEITSQAIADIAKNVWEDWRRALNAGRHAEASELEKEFSELCELFQGN